MQGSTMMVGQPLEVSKLVYAWLEGVELFSRKSTVRVLPMTHSQVRVIFRLIYSTNILIKSHVFIYYFVHCPSIVKSTD